MKNFQKMGGTQKKEAVFKNDIENKKQGKISGSTMKKKGGKWSTKLIKEVKQEKKFSVLTGRFHHKSGRFVL